ncbi:MAG: AAA family ATPase [Sphingobacteriales bacterium]|nr:MAG: AAA family ATPase [Sphingobacteriales bacterium]
MESNVLKREIKFKGDLFSKHFIDSKSYFLFLCQKLPSITVVRNVDHEKVYRAIKKEFAENIKEEYHYTAIAKKKLTQEKEESVLILEQDLLVELGDGYCEFYFSDPENALLKQMISRVAALRGNLRSRPQEINLITRGDYGLELTRMDVKRTSLKLDLFYEDDFLDVHKTIMSRLNKKEDKGIVLLHGLPGTGKTTYLRYLAGKIKKRVLFIPPDMASQIANPELIRLLVDHPNSVLIIEDAENILMQRQAGSDSGVSNLLNIADGLLSDFLNVQIVCTFNSSMNLVDKAMVRKGRLIASYEFRKLSPVKAQQLSNHLGYGNPIHQPMTLTEIANQRERSFVVQERPIIGFRNTSTNTIIG